MDKDKTGVYNGSTMAVASLLNDTVFKFVFGEEKRKPILICLLNALLLLKGRERISEIEILNPHLERESLDDKLAILDIRAKDGAAKHYNIEVQVDPPRWYVKRAVYYAAKLLSSQLIKGHQYDEVQKTIGISLLGRALLDEEEMHTICRLENISTHRELTDILELHFIELSKINKLKPRELQSPFERWLHFLKFGEYYVDEEAPLPRELKEEEGIEMALDAYKEVNADKYMRQIIEDRFRASCDAASFHALWAEQARDKIIEQARTEMIEQARTEIIEQARTEIIEQARPDIEVKAMAQGVIESARRMLQAGIERGEVARILGLQEDGF
jgi:predicted transposase/invertase (TIGR01784 family)